MELGEGGTSKIVEDIDPRYVCKVLKRRRFQKNASLQTEKEYHQRIFNLIQEKIPDLGIHVPALKPGVDSYCMERIDTGMPLSDLDMWNSLDKDTQNLYIKNINIFLTMLSKESIYLTDVEAYIQPDGRLMFIDFGQVTSLRKNRLNSAAVVPESVVNKIKIGGRTRRYRKRR